MRTQIHLLTYLLTLDKAGQMRFLLSVGNTAAKLHQIINCETDCHSRAALDIDLQLDLPRDQTLITSTAVDRPIYSSAATFVRQFETDRLSVGVKPRVWWLLIFVE